MDVGILAFNKLSAHVRCLVLLTLSVALAAMPVSAQVPAEASAPRSQGALVGYFPQWGLYNESPYTVKSLAANGGASLLDQINYAQGFVTGGHCSVADPNADLNYTFTAQTSVDGTPDQPAQLLRGNFHQLQELKRLNPRLRLLISLEGRGSDFAADAQPEARAAFVASCVDIFLRGNFAPGVTAPSLFDGIDLDWEYPRGADAANYLPLLEEFRRQMNALRPGILLTVALDSSPAVYGSADIAALGRVVDRAGLMTYDFNGPWNGTTGFIAPLASASPDEWSVERSVAAWIHAGIPANKLLMGLPFYGYGWRGVADVNHGLGQQGNPIRGDRPYRFLESLSTAASAPVLYRDPVSQAPWLFDGDAFWTYEDATSIRSKASLIGREQLGGFMVWELSEDTASGTLLSAARAALVHPQGLPDTQSKAFSQLPGPRLSGSAPLRLLMRAWYAWEAPPVMPAGSVPAPHAWEAHTSADEGRAEAGSAQSIDTHHPAQFAAPLRRPWRGRAISNPAAADTPGSHPLRAPAVRPVL